MIPGNVSAAPGTTGIGLRRKNQASIGKTKTKQASPTGTQMAAAPQALTVGPCDRMMGYKAAKDWST